MFTAKGAREINDTLTIRVGAGQPALRIIQQDGDTVLNEGPTHNFGVSMMETSTSPAVPGRKPRPSQQDQPGRRSVNTLDAGPSSRPRRTDDAPGEFTKSRAAIQNPAVEFTVPTRFSGTAVFDNPVFTSQPIFVNPNTGQAKSLDDLITESLEHRRNPKMDRSIGGSGGTSAYFGVVQSGSGSQWSVTLYQSGASGAAGDTVAVEIPFIDESETAPANVTVGPIFLIGDTYIYQPPVWLE
jgi:hypothetical protein